MLLFTLKTKGTWGKNWREVSRSWERTPADSQQGNRGLRPAAADATAAGH